MQGSRTRRLREAGVEVNTYSSISDDELDSVVFQMQKIQIVVNKWYMDT